MVVRSAQEDLWAKGARWRWSAESMEARREGEGEGESA